MKVKACNLHAKQGQLQVQALRILAKATGHSFSIAELQLLVPRVFAAISDTSSEVRTAALPALQHIIEVRKSFMR